MKKYLWIQLIFLLITISTSVESHEIIKEFDAPGPEARGLAWDGQYLWGADALKDSIFKIDPVSGLVLHRIYFDFNTAYGGGIAWSSDEALWVIRMQYFYELDPISGEGIANFHCPGG